MSNELQFTVVPPQPVLVNGFHARPDLPPSMVVVFLDELIARADAFVTVDARGVATLEPSASNQLNELELAHVRLLLQHHNSLPKELRASPGRAHIDPDVSGGASAKFYTFWWGFRIYFNHYACNDIELILGAGGAATGALTGYLVAVEVLTAANAGPIGLAVGIIATMLAWFVWADAADGNRGANYNQSWTVQGWMTTV